MGVICLLFDAQILSSHACLVGDLPRLVDTLEMAHMLYSTVDLDAVGKFGYGNLYRRV
jgi:hypothetical protein